MTLEHSPRRPSRLPVLRALAVLRVLTPGPVAADTARAGLLALACGVGAAAVLIVRLLVPTVVGMADQGDGTRLLCALGLASTAPFDYEESLAYVHTGWVAHLWHGEACGVDGSGETYLSTQTLLILPAMLLTRLVEGGDGLDLRFVGVVCALVFGALIASLVATLPGRRPFRVLIAGLITCVAADGVFADFFVSSYSEPAAFLGVLGLFVAVLHHWASPRQHPLRVFLVVVAAVFAIGAKHSMLALAPIVIVALLWPRAAGETPAPATEPEPLPEPDPDLTPGVRRRRKLAPLLVSIAAAAVVAGAAVGMALAQPTRSTELDVYNAVFIEMLPHSPDAEADLEWFGLDPSLASAAGATVNDPNSAALRADYRTFAETITPVHIVGFYLSHPARLVPLADRAVMAMTHPTLEYLGSFTPDSEEEPRAKDHRFTPVEGVLGVLSAVPLLLVVVQLLAFVLAWGAAMRQKLGRRATALGRAGVVLSAIVCTQFWMVTLIEGGNELNRSLLVADLATMLMVPVALAAALLLSRPTDRRPEILPAEIGSFDEPVSPANAPDPRAAAAAIHDR